MKYQKRPIVIEAMQWTGGNTTELLRWMFPDIEPDATANELTIKTLEGEMRASPGDWIIRGWKGEFYPCKPDIFEASYQLADGPKSGVDLIADERQRQIAVEGWSPAHDDGHKHGELTAAAISYAGAAHKMDLQVKVYLPPHCTCGARGLADCSCLQLTNIEKTVHPWPWEREWWKPSEDPIRNLVKAGALIAAEIDRLKRISVG